MPMTGIEKVLKAVGGSPSALAAAVSTKERTCTRQNVQYWVRQGYVPSGWARRVGEVFDVPLHELNPAVYPGPSEAAA
jgi:hypothetical protein